VIAQWMLYSVVVAFCFGFAAAAGEALLRLSGRPGRWAWGLALVCSAGWPLLNMRFPGLLARSVVHPAIDSGASIVIGAFGPGEVGVNALVDSNGVLLDRLLLTAWVVLSVVFLYVVVWTSLKLLSERRGWSRALVGGRSVLVSSDVGPAVVGFRKPEIVVPSWVLDLDEAEQRLVVLHEGEHARAGDLRLLVSGLAAAVLLPWNPAVWWQVRRLRLAVEADCDARVLGHGTGAHSYGAFLMNICGRTQRLRVAALALSERRSPLARRIEMMVPKTRGRLGRLVLSMTVCVAALTLACEFPIPFGHESADEMSEPRHALRPSHSQRAFPEFEEGNAPQIRFRAEPGLRELPARDCVRGFVSVQTDEGPDGTTESRLFPTTRTARLGCSPSDLKYLNQVPLKPAVYVPAEATFPTQTLVHYETWMEQRASRNRRYLTCSS
jgi:bla regulator protein blaR1